jgi:hypothetical protein
VRRHARSGLLNEDGTFFRRFPRSSSAILGRPRFFFGGWTEGAGEASLELDDCFGLLTIWEAASKIHSRYSTRCFISPAALAIPRALSSYPDRSPSGRRIWCQLLGRRSSCLSWWSILTCVGDEISDSRVEGGLGSLFSEAASDNPTLDRCFPLAKNVRGARRPSGSHKTSFKFDRGRRNVLYLSREQPATRGSARNGPPRVCTVEIVSWTVRRLSSGWRR